MPLNPGGLCQCGCGRPAPLARQTLRKLGYVKGEPVRYCRGHNTRKARPLCACGCGERVVGHRAKWIKGHDKWKPRPEPNPSGLCMCGCGRKTPLAKRHRADRGELAGKPIKYIFGHYGKIPPPVPDEKGCLIWQGAKGTHERGTAGGGRKGVSVLAYRLYYERHVGPIPKGYHVHHTCETPMCVNPDHLLAVTPEEHARLHRVAA